MLQGLSASQTAAVSPGAQPDFSTPQRAAHSSSRQPGTLGALPPYMTTPGQRQPGSSRGLQRDTPELQNQSGNRPTAIPFEAYAQHQGGVPDTPDTAQQGSAHSAHCASLPLQVLADTIAAAAVATAGVHSPLAQFASASAAVAGSRPEAPLSPAAGSRPEASAAFSSPGLSAFKLNRKAMLRFFV